MRFQILQSALLAVTLLAVSSVAQEQTETKERGRRGGMMVDRQVAAMKERLKLTSEQEQKVKPILTDAGKKMMELRRKGEPGQAPTEEMRTEMTKQREETRQKLSEVLSKDQMAEYERMLSEGRRGGFGRSGGRGSRNQ